MIGAIQKVQFRSNCIVLYDQPEYAANTHINFKQRILANIELARTKAYSGAFSDGAMKRLARCIDLLVQTVRPKRIFCPVLNRRITHRVAFITLTVSQIENITAREAYDKAFKHFIQWMRRTMRVNTYVWKAEVQKRGQIHYHITTPSYIHYQKIRDKWNNLQHKAGWTDDYYKMKGHYDPNSTDIHQVKKIKDLSNYLKKEFCKAIQNPNGTGKVWDCSENLKAEKYFTIEETRKLTWTMSNMIESNQVAAIPLEKCIVLKFNKGSPVEVMDLDHLMSYEKLLDTIRNNRGKQLK